MEYIYSDDDDDDDDEFGDENNYDDDVDDDDQSMSVNDEGGVSPLLSSSSEFASDDHHDQHEEQHSISRDSNTSSTNDNKYGTGSNGNDIDMIEIDDHDISSSSQHCQHPSNRRRRKKNTSTSAIVSRKSSQLSTRQDLENAYYNALDLATHNDDDTFEDDECDFNTYDNEEEGITTPQLNLVDKADAAIQALQQIILREAELQHNMRKESGAPLVDEGNLGRWALKATKEIIRLYISEKKDVHRAKEEYFALLRNLTGTSTGTGTETGTNFEPHRQQRHNHRLSLQDSQEMEDDIVLILEEFCHVVRSIDCTTAISPTIAADIKYVTDTSSEIAIENNESTTNTQAAPVSPVTSDGRDRHDSFSLLTSIFEKTRTTFHPVTGDHPLEKLWFKTNLKYGRMILNHTSISAKFVHPSTYDRSRTIQQDPLKIMSLVLDDLTTSTSRHICADASSNICRTYIRLHRAQVCVMSMYVSQHLGHGHSLLRDKYALVQQEVDRGCILDHASESFMETMKPILFVEQDSISEDIWSGIMQYCCSTNFSEFLTYGMRKLALISKEFYRVCKKTVKTFPVNLISGNLCRGGCKNKFYPLSWACRNETKIGKFIYAHIHPGAIIHVFDQCNMRELSVLSLEVLLPKYLSVSQHETWMEVERTSALGVEVGIPDNLFTYNKCRADDLYSLHEHIADRMRDQYQNGSAPIVKELSIAIYKEKAHLQLFELLRHSVEKLHLTIYTGEVNRQGEIHSYDAHMQAISAMIEKMTSLKSLKIFCHFSALFEIRSSSLRSISTVSSNTGFCVERCICPSLEKFRCAHRSVAGEMLYNGVIPTIPFSRNDLTPLPRRSRGNLLNGHGRDIQLARMMMGDRRLRGLEIEAWFEAGGDDGGRNIDEDLFRGLVEQRENDPHHVHADPHHRDWIVSFRFSERAFRGMEVPGRCVIYIYEGSRTVERIFREEQNTV